MSEPRYRRSANGASLSWSGALWLESEVSAVLFEGDAAGALERVLEACAAPRTLAELTALFPELDADDVSALVALLEEHGHLGQEAPAESAASLSLVGAAPATATLREALAARGVGVVERPSVSELDGAPRDVLLVAASILDPTLRSSVEAAPEDVRLVPCVASPRASLVGPPWRRRDGGAACPHCLVLRWLARAPAEAHATLQEAAASKASSGAFLDEARAVALAGAVLRQLTEGKGELLSLDEGVLSRHPLRRHPGCGACAPAKPTASPSALTKARDEVERTFAKHLEDDEDLLPPSPADLLGFEDPKVGLVFLAEDHARRRSYFRELPFVYGGVALAREDAVLSTGFSGAVGVGVSLEHKRAVCFSEAIERYAQHAFGADLVDVTAHDLGEHAFEDVDGLTYEPSRYAEAGFRYRPYTRDTPLRWSWGVSLLDGRARLFPQEAVALGLTDEGYPRRLFDRQVSTGGAAHVSYRRALCSALREVAERDQAMIAWYKRVPLPRVRVPERTGDVVTDELQAFLRERGVVIDVFDLRLDLRAAPNLLVSATRTTSEGSWPAGGRVTIASCRATAIEALRHGLLEICVSYETQCLSPDERKDFRASSYDPRDPEQGWASWWPLWLYYLDPAHADAFAFLDGGLPEVDLLALPSLASGTPREELRALTAMFEGAGLEPFAFDLNTPDLEGSGRRAMKVVVPGTLDVSVGRQSVRLRAPRLERVPSGLGRPHLATAEHNPDPHPAI